MALFRVVGIGFAGLALACGATGGSAWVTQPEPGPFEDDELAVALAGRSVEPVSERHTSRFVSELESDAGERPRPRLDRTVTLGEIVATDTSRSEAAQTPVAAPVNVTVNNYVQSQPSYDGYYAVPVYTRSRGDGGVRPAPHSNSAPSRPGQNWPALPSYGPSFPFKTAPASPWR